MVNPATTSLTSENYEGVDQWGDLVQCRSISGNQDIKVLDILDRVMLEPFSRDFGDSFITQIKVPARLVVEGTEDLPGAMGHSIDNALVDFLDCDRASRLPVAAVLVHPVDEDIDQTDNGENKWAAGWEKG